ncbi:sensor histidine kinase [Natronincola ferrireducens]|uniref:histidine kinase n=1 Tax=Natronincola ferrireducens TaxID=393762 RepID=A0A1G8Z440_9FIRM|nr:HAMP domain-containing sensor histidine kinase [Natronincola ferrireducens]SDK09899.1 Histidine kinase-, DNA gyrase B-, and HSP90-like ATPase [Natronincola ferrireducens]
MYKNIMKRIKVKYILENIYLEMLFLYMSLIFVIGIPLLREMTIAIARLAIVRVLVRALFRVEYIIKFILFEELIDILSLVSILTLIFIFIIIVIIRIRRGIFLKTLLLYSLFKNYNNDFKVYTGIALPIILAISYFMNYLFSYRLTRGDTTRVLIMLIVTMGLLNYAQQVSIIIGNIKNIHDDKKNYMDTGCPAEFTLEAMKMLDNIDQNIQSAIEKELKSERLKTELITNVSHDIKTPLTSIINYTNLLKDHDFKDDTILSYINSLDRNSQRLKLLITDIVEASKTETGNINLYLEKLELNELISQIYGGFDRIFHEKNISFIFNPKDDIFVFADGNYLGRVLENIIGNASKYTLENTRIYCTVKEESEFVSFTLKNVSKDELNIDVDELMEQFIRGEKSRHTEGSGLGLYITRNLMRLMNGDLLLGINGDLFKAKLLIPRLDK